MLLLHTLPKLSFWSGPLVDSALLSILIFPIVYSFGFRPLTLQIAVIQQTETTLRDSENRFRALFDTSRDAIMTLEPPSWKFTSGNLAAVRMFGARDAEHFTTLGSWELSPEQQPDGRASTDKAKEMIETAMRDGSHFFEWTHRRANGKSFPTTVLLSRMELAGKMFLQATVRDITQLKQTEEALRDSQALYESLVGSLSQCVFRKDLAGRFTFANQPFCQLLRKTPADILGRTDCDFFPAELAESYRKDDLGVVQNRLPLERIEENSLLTGERGYVQVVKTPLLNAAGEVVGVQGIFWDVTERKRAETERERLIAELQTALAEVKTLMDDKKRTGEGPDPIPVNLVP